MPLPILTDDRNPDPQIAGGFVLGNQPLHFFEALHYDRKTCALVSMSLSLFTHSLKLARMESAWLISYNYVQLINYYSQNKPTFSKDGKSMSNFYFIQYNTTK